VSASRALITAGSNFRDLHTLGECSYRFVDPHSLELSDLVVLARGSYLRLGNVHNGDLYYSDGWQVPHQLFKSDSALYYTDGAPNGRIFRNEIELKLRVDLFVEVGKAVESGPWLYFEANRKHECPQGWEVWRADLNTWESEFVTMGANPAIFESTLFCDRWNRSGRFDVVTRPL